jgi:hypothetical protein
MTGLPAEVQWATIRDLEGRVRIAKAAVNGTLLRSLAVGAARPVAIDGTTLGKVQVKRTPDVVIENESEFLEWVRANYPTEVYETVRPAFRDHVIEEAKTNGALPPGVALVEGDPYVSYSAYKTPPAHLWAQLLEVSDGVR